MLISEIEAILEGLDFEEAELVAVLEESYPRLFNQQVTTTVLERNSAYQKIQSCKIEWQDKLNELEAESLQEWLSNV